MRGNLVAITSTGGTINYSYDYANRLSQVQLPSGGGTYNYSYDADGRRVRQQSGSSITSYLWDEQGYGNVAVEVSGANQTSYVMAGGELLFENQNGTPSYYLPDGNMNIRQLANNSGTVTDKYSYDAYGNTTHVSGTSSNPYLYKGQQYDAQTSLYNLRARYYTATSGRFLSRDSASFDFQDPRELNRYVYTADDPVNRYDPSGLFSLDEFALRLKLSILPAVGTIVALGDTLEADEEGILSVARAAWWRWTIQSLRGQGGKSVLTVATTWVKQNEEIEGRFIEEGVAVVGTQEEVDLAQRIANTYQNEDGIRINLMTRVVPEGGLPNAEHAEQLIYNAYHADNSFTEIGEELGNIGLSNANGPCSACKDFFFNKVNPMYTNIQWWNYKFYGGGYSFFADTWRNPNLPPPRP